MLTTSASTGRTLSRFFSYHGWRKRKVSRMAQEEGRNHKGREKRGEEERRRKEWQQSAGDVKFAPRVDLMEWHQMLSLTNI